MAVEPTLPRHIDPLLNRVSPTTSVIEVLQQISSRQGSGCAVVEEQGRLVGLFTEQHGIQLAAQGHSLGSLTVGEVMTRSVPALSYEQAQDLEFVLSRLRQDRVRYLPVVLETGEPIGVISGESLCQAERLKSSHLEESDPDRFFNLSLDMLCIASLEGYFTQINPAFEKILGYPRQQILAQPFLHWIHPEDQEPTLGALAQLSRGEAIVSFENRYRCRDGSYRWLMWSSVPYLQEGRVYAVARDVTERKRVEEELRRQARYDRLLADVTRKVRRSLQLPTILQTTVQEVRNLLNCDRVLMVRQQFDETAVVIQESIRSGWPSMLNVEYSLPAQSPRLQSSSQERSPASMPLTLCQQYEIRSQLTLQISVRDNPWGFLIVQQCDRHRQWEAGEEELLKQLADQLGLALSQSQLLHHLEELVEKRTLELSNTNRNLQQQIQERLSMEAELRENQEKLAGILDTADEAIISIDEQQLIQFFNQGAERIFGYEAREILGQPLSLLIPDPYQKPIQDFQGKTSTSKRMSGSQGEIWGRRKTGEIFPAEASLSRLVTRRGVLFTSILKDVTERRRAEKALQRNQGLLQKIIDNSPAVISVMDLNHCHLLVNRRYGELISIAPDLVVGRSVHEVWSAEVAAAIVDHHQQCLASKTSIQVEEILTHIEGPHTYLSSIFPLQTESGELYAICSISTDISDRKAIEKLKDEFISVVSHELRTPLTSIHGSLKLLATGRFGEMTEAGQEMLTIAAENTQRLIRLVRDVLDLERLQSGEFPIHRTTCEATQLITQATEIMRPLAYQQGIQLEIKPTSVLLWASPDLILQTLTNLLSNAIKFSPDKTTVKLEVNQTASEVIFQITDQGRGIPPDKLQTIFERFQQVDASDSRAKGGTGLGLAICRNIIEKQGGQIWVESVLGQGSTFYFSLPKAAEHRGGEHVS